MKILRRLARTTLARMLFSERRWFRRLHGGQWRRTYVDMPVCSCLWLNVPDGAGPDYREGLWRGRADIEVHP